MSPFSVTPSTQPGAVLEIPGKGLPRYRAPWRGSLNVPVTIPIPTTLNQRQRRLYEQPREQDTARGTSRSPAGCSRVSTVTIVAGARGGTASRTVISRTPSGSPAAHSTSVTSASSPPSRVPAVPPAAAHHSRRVRRRRAI
jgi:hypothetical protein